MNSSELIRGQNSQGRGSTGYSREENEPPLRMPGSQQHENRIVGASRFNKPEERCSIHGRGHSDENCRLQSGARGGSSTKARPSSRNCWNCNSPNHVAQNCPKKPDPSYPFSPTVRLCEVQVPREQMHPALRSDQLSIVGSARRNQRNSHYGGGSENAALRLTHPQQRNDKERRMTESSKSNQLMWAVPVPLLPKWAHRDRSWTKSVSQCQSH